MPADHTRITVLYDPLCGWCYGAAPTLQRLANESAIAFEILPTGLFAGAGARPLAAFAAHAWTADQRIAGLTGQPFSSRYRERVLGDPQARLDSGPAIQALTAVALAAPAREVRALAAIQTARYVDGRDVTSDAELADIVAELGLPQVAARIAAPDDELRAATVARIDLGQRRLRGVGATGVPTLVVDDRIVASDALYQPFSALLRRVRAA